jgi:outer membrane autotransporter protein
MSGGEVDNDLGLIQGGMNGLHITENYSYVYNYNSGCSIVGVTNVGVLMTAGGEVDNGGNGNTGGLIQGGTDGVQISGGNGSVYNYGGTIVGQSGAGVRLIGGGGDPSVENEQAGIIQGGTDGVFMSGNSGEVDNYDGSRIVGQTHAGVYMTAGGEVYNGYADEGIAGGLIQGGTDGVLIAGGEGSVYNYQGSIVGQTGAGVSMIGSGYDDDDPYVANESGKILGGTDGVRITDNYGQVYNSAGLIVGLTNAGVYMGAGGEVDNMQGGRIQGGTDGVKIAGSSGSVYNYDVSSIVGQTGAGVNMSAGGYVYNEGYIEGNIGVKITGGQDSVVNSGTIIGDGGTAILLGNNSYNTVILRTGSYVQGDINGGTGAAILQGTGSFAYNLTNFATLTVQADPTTLGWDLTGNGTFSQNATVQSGLLQVDGSLTTRLLTVNMDTNGLTGLGGSGVIIGNVNDRGYLAPGNPSLGNPFGTLTIIGSLTATNSGNFYANVNAAGNHNQALVSGAATINDSGEVIVQTAPGIYSVQTVYPILTATNGIFGLGYAGSTNYSFWIQSPLFPISGTSLQYDSHNIYVVLDRTPFASVARTSNERSVAGALDDLNVAGLSGAMANLVSEIYWMSSASEVRAALDSMGGQIHGTLGMLDMQQQDAFNRSVSLRTGRISAGYDSAGCAPASSPVGGTNSACPLRQAKACEPWDFWLQGFGTFGRLKNDADAIGGNFGIGGLSGGVDYRLRPELLVGLAAGYSMDNASVGGPGASGKVDAVQFAGYCGYVSGPWHMDSIFSYGFLRTEANRMIEVGDISQMATANYDGGVLSFSAEGGYVFKAGPVKIEPTVGLDYARLSQGSFAEGGTASDGYNYGLDVRKVEMDSFRSALGVRLGAEFGGTNCVKFIPELHARWEHEFEDKGAYVTASFIGGSSDFGVTGVQLSADSGIVGAALTVEFNRAFHAFLNYDASLNCRLNAQGISGGLSYSW